jgi:hypothetical protein
MTYYELNSELLPYKLDAYKMFISRASHKLIPPQIKDYNTNFVNLLLQIVASVPGDNNANHNPATMTAVGSNGATGGYWQIRSPANSVIFGEELIVELEYVLPPLIWQKATTREPGAPSNGEFPYIRDLVNGRATLIVTRVSDGSQVILNQQGGVMTGAYNLPQGRLMANLTYCMGSFGSDPIMWSKCTGLEVWTRAPYQMIPS